MIIAVTEDGILARIPSDPNAGYVILKTPVQCVCGRMACIGVNRDGKTLCLECDKKRHR